MNGPQALAFTLRAAVTLLDWVVESARKNHPIFAEDIARISVEVRAAARMAEYLPEAFEQPESSMRWWRVCFKSSDQDTKTLCVHVQALSAKHARAVAIGEMPFLSYEVFVSAEVVGGEG